MKISVKEAVCEAAQALGIWEWVQAYLDGGDSEMGEKDTNVLVECFNRVQNELALDYLPLLAEDELMTATGVIAYTELMHPATRILCVENEVGESVKFKLFPNRLETQEGKVKVFYAYAPTEQDIDGVCEYETGVSKRLFVYGMAAEYFSACGLFEEAAVWDRKYKAAIEAAYKKRPSRKIRSRRWI